MVVCTKNGDGFLSADNSLIEEAKEEEEGLDMEFLSAEREAMESCLLLILS